MTDDDPKLHCHACGHLIGGPVRTYRCPACGSYDVALPPLLKKLDEDLAADRAGRCKPITRIPPIRYLSSTPPQGMPPALWSHLRPLRVLCGCTLILLGVGAVAFVLESTIARYGLLSALIINCFLAPMTPYYAKRRLRRFAQEIIDDNLERCLECGYPLKGLPEKHRCPECGEPYNIAVVKKTWERYFEAQQTKR